MEFAGTGESLERPIPKTLGNLCMWLKIFGAFGVLLALFAGMQEVGLLTGSSQKCIYLLCVVYLILHTLCYGYSTLVAVVMVVHPISTNAG